MSKPTRHLLAASVFACAITGCFSPTRSASMQTAGSSTAADETGTSGTPTPATGENEVSTTSSGTTGSEDEICGDGVIDPSEVCDDGVNDGAYDGCSADCSAFAPRCGDGDINGQEDCDDSDDVNGNGCNNDCRISGSVLWTHEGSPEDCLVSAWRVDFDSTNQIYAAGSMQCPGEPWSAWLASYEANASLRWTTTWGTDTALAFSSVETEDGVAVVGISGTQSFLRVYDSLGTLVEGSFPQPTSGYFGGVRNSANGLIAAGALAAKGAISNNVIHGMDASGSVSWAIPAEPGVWEDLDISEDGTAFVVAGRIGLNGQEDILVRQFSIDGMEIWSRTIVGTAGAEDFASGVAFDQQGNVVVIGNLSDDVRRFWVRKYGPDGTSLWTHTSHGATADIRPRLAIDSSGAIVTAATLSIDGMQSGQVQKLSASGTVMWTKENDGDANLGLLLSDVAIDGNDNIVVTGVVRLSEKQSEFWMEKYAP